MTKSKKISRTEAVKMIKNSKGRFFSVTFTKNNKKKRTLNGNVNSKRFTTELGYILFNSSKKGMKSINPKTIEELHMDKQIYIVQ